MAKGKAMRQLQTIAGSVGVFLFVVIGAALARPAAAAEPYCPDPAHLIKVLP
jgi:hypothetical protein